MNSKKLLSVSKSASSRQSKRSLASKNNPPFQRPNRRPTPQGVTAKVAQVMSPGDAARKLESTTTAKVVDSVLFLGSMASGVSSLVTAATAGLTDQLIGSMGIRSPKYKAALEVSSHVVLATAVPSLGIPYLASKVMRGPISRGSAYLAGQLPKDWTISQVLAYKAAQFAGTAATVQVTESLVSSFSSSSQESPSRSPESSQSPESAQASDSSQALDSSNVDQASVGQSGPSHKAKVYGYADMHESTPGGGREFSRATVQAVKERLKPGDKILAEGCDSDDTSRLKDLDPFYIECDSEITTLLRDTAEKLSVKYRAIKAATIAKDAKSAVEHCRAFVELTKFAEELGEGRNKIFEDVVEMFAREWPAGNVHFVAGFDHFTSKLINLLDGLHSSRPDIEVVSANTKRAEKQILNICQQWFNYADQMSRFN